MSKIIKKIEYDCPFCEEKHEVEVWKYESKTKVKDQEINYIKKSYYCPIEDDEFLPAKILDENLFNSREAYRKVNGLLTVNEIKEIRNMYGLTQKEYANLLGLGDITIQRYEKKSIQDGTYDMIMRLTRDNPQYCLNMLDKNKKHFEMERYLEIRNQILERIKLCGEDYLVKESIQMKYIEFEEKSENNGFTLLNLNKISIIMNYMAHYIDNLYKVKMMKLLWYVDQVSYKRYKKAITGLVYQHMPLGALPIAHYDLMKLPSIRVDEEEHEEYTSYKIFPAREIATTELSFEEVSIIQEVIKKFRNYSTKEIVNYMHEENVYKTTEENEILIYSDNNLIANFD